MLREIKGRSSFILEASEALITMLESIDRSFRQAPQSLDSGHRGGDGPALRGDVAEEAELWAT